MVSWLYLLPKLIELFYTGWVLLYVNYSSIYPNSHSALVRPLSTHPTQIHHCWEHLGTRIRAPELRNQPCPFWRDSSSEPLMNFKIWCHSPFWIRGVSFNSLGVQPGHWEFFKSFPSDLNDLDTELPKSRDYKLFNFVFPDSPWICAYRALATKSAILEADW